MSDSSKCVPFPLTEDPRDSPMAGAASAHTRQGSQISPVHAFTSNDTSHATGSTSQVTSSDKLSALPQPASPRLSPPIGNRQRTSAFMMNPTHRTWRRSLDASASVPSFPAGDYDSGALNYGIWGNYGANSHLAARLEGFGRQAAGHSWHGTPENGSNGKETPKQRVSFDDDRASVPTMRSVGQALSRYGNTSPPPGLRSSVHVDQNDDGTTGNQPGHTSPSRSRSRAQSPLRLIQQWSSNLHRGSRVFEEPFVPINPYRLRSRFPLCCFPSPKESDLEEARLNVSAFSGAYECEDILPVDEVRTFLGDSRIFFTDTLARELYLNFLLRLPAVYFSRVARIFEDAEVSRPDIQRMIEASCRTRRSTLHPSVMEIQPQSTPAAVRTPAYTQQLTPGIAQGVGLSTQIGTAPAATTLGLHTPLPFPDEWTASSVSPALMRFKHSWEAFIDSLLREWKTLNVVSALLASAILTIFQIPSAADDPVTRTCALLSLICALMSLSYGCMYIVRFGTMRSMFHASRWAEEARKTKTSIWWNVWVLLATPAVWMAWSMLLFICAILSFVWRTGSVADPPDRPPLSTKAALGPRIIITAVFVLGMIYLALIVRTLKKYGSSQGAARALLQVGADARLSALDRSANVRAASNVGVKVKSMETGSRGVGLGLSADSVRETRGEVELGLFRQESDPRATDTDRYNIQNENERRGRNVERKSSFRARRSDSVKRKKKGDGHGLGDASGDMKTNTKERSRSRRLKDMLGLDDDSEVAGLGQQVPADAREIEMTAKEKEVQIEVRVV